MSSESFGDFLREARTGESALFRTHYVAAITALKVLVTGPKLSAMIKPTHKYCKVSYSLEGGFFICFFEVKQSSKICLKYRLCPLTTCCALVFLTAAEFLGVGLGF